MDKLENTLRKVRGLLAKADSTTSAEEADAFRRGAEALMFKYRIDESQLTAEEKASEHFSIQWRTIVLCTEGSKFSWVYASILAESVRHMDCKYQTRYVLNQETKRYEYIAEVVGYGSDLSFIDMLYTSAALAFRSQIEPKVDPALSDQVNAYRLRSAGMGGREIALALYGKDDKALRPKVRKMFEREAILRGEDPTPLLGKGVNVERYRESYAQGFAGQWSTRLFLMRSERNEGGLILANRAEAIAEEFYAKFPSARPKAAVPGQAGTKHHECPKCAKASSGYCREHGWLRPKRGRVRYANMDGLRRGQDAARSVDIGRHGTGRLGS